MGAEIMENYTPLIADLRGCATAIGRKSRFFTVKQADMLLSAAETIEKLTERPGAEWQWVDEDGDSFFVCSACGRPAYNTSLEIVQGEFKFCPRCGAKMAEDFRL